MRFVGTTIGLWFKPAHRCMISICKALISAVKLILVMLLARVNRPFSLLALKSVVTLYLKLNCTKTKYLLGVPSV